MKRSSVRIIGMAALASALWAGCLMSAGCDFDRETRVERAQEPGLALQATSREIYSGEIATVTAETANLLGRDAEVRWSTTGGELTTQDRGRIARVKFDSPGTYVVSAQLWSDGELVKTDSVTIEVRSLR